MSSKYHFLFSEEAEVNFAHLPRVLQARILKKISFWEKSGKPLSFGKALVNQHARFRFRVGDYRIIVSENPQAELVILLILKIAHRSTVYED